VGVRYVSALILVAVAGCSLNGNEPSGPIATSRVERCVDRLLARAELGDASEAERQATRRYTRVTYCAPFAREGWIHGDGALSIDAYLHVRRGMTCAESPSLESSTTVPCEDREDPVLDCALLHHVRRSEVVTYFAKHPAYREKRCDDGTPLGDLGATPAAGTG